MKKLAVFLVGAIALAGCGGGGTNPFMDQAPTDQANTSNENKTDDNNANSNTTNNETQNGGINSGGTPGASSGSVSQSAQNRFVVIEDDAGQLTNVSYVEQDDGQGTMLEYLYVDNLPFDGLEEMPYLRYKLHPTSEGVGLFLSQDSVTDPIAQITIGQHDYLALYGKSDSGSSEFVIVKTGSYLSEGFGGHILQRNQYASDGTAVEYERPMVGQGVFTGTYDGLRVNTNGVAELGHTRGDVMFAIDFEDFKSGSAIVLRIDNRTLSDIGGAGDIELPTIYNTVSADMLDADGKYHFDIFSLDGANNKIETGTITGLLVGNEPIESVAIIRLTSSDDTGSYTETGGFFAYRRPTSP